MPDVLAHLPDSEREDAANALAHFLATLGQPMASELPQPGRGGTRGEAVSLGGLRGLSFAGEDAVRIGAARSVGGEVFRRESGGVPRTTAGGPRPGGRMPDCHLERAEAADLASYLLRDQELTPLTPFSPEPALAARGKAVHRAPLPRLPPHTGEPLASPVLTDSASCVRARAVSSDQPGAWPQYPLAERQRAGCGRRFQRRQGLDAEEEVQLTLTRLNCLACHQRDASRRSRGRSAASISPARRTSWGSRAACRHR